MPNSLGYRQECSDYFELFTLYIQNSVKISMILNLATLAD